jgi:hypothetical protein
MIYVIFLGAIIAFPLSVRPQPALNITIGSQFTIRFVLSILSDIHGGPVVVPRQITFWINDFLRSPFSHGVYVISEGLIPNVSLPQVLTNVTGLSRSAQQAKKRCHSLAYFVSNTTAPFLLAINHDTVIWTRNLKYLAAEIQSRGMTSDSNFILGPCMANWEGTFLQGSTYVYSRTSAKLLLPFCNQYILNAPASEDVGFRSVMAAIGLTSFVNASSAYLIGQYISFPQLSAMENMNMGQIQDCPINPGHARGCAPVMEQYNKLVALHRLSTLRLTNLPKPVYDYPDNLFWYQAGEMTTMCIRK